MFRGVAQGDHLSATLFSLTLQTALTRLSEAVGICVAGVFIHYLAIVDDSALVAQTRASLQLAPTTSLNQANVLGLEPGLCKCATMGISYVGYSST